MVLLASRSIGNAGTMEIHDNSGVVSMRVRSSDGQTHTGALPWRAIVNGVWVPNSNGSFGTVNYPSGSPWVTVGAWSVGYSQQVMFEIGNTNTWGLGAGGQLYANVSRATVPPPGSNIGLDEITTTSIRYRFINNGDGGSPILEWQAQCAENATFTIGVINSLNSTSGTRVFTGLAPAKTHYFRARGRNAVGWGGWTSVVSATTLSVMYVGKSGSFPSAASVGVGKGTTFVTPQILVGKGGSFVPPA